MPDKENNTLEYIEAYFTQELSSEERKHFEVRCEQDALFARDVAFYLTARNAAHELLMEEKQNAGSTDRLPESKAMKVPPLKRMPLRKWLPYAVAACVVLFVASFLYLQSQSPARLAANYVYKNYVQKPIGITMDASHDSLQLGIEAYNSKDYKRAQELFDGVRKSKPDVSDAKKYAGLAYLQTKNYDEALECFEALATMGGLYNDGDILAAATLLQRNANGDKDKARRLMEKVVRAQETGSKVATEWLDKL